MAMARAAHTAATFEGRCDRGSVRMNWLFVKRLRPFMLLAAIASLLYVLWMAVHWAVVVLYVTERRLLEVGGFFTMSIAVLPLTKLTDLKFEQGFLGRLFTYGSIRVETAGQVQALSLIADVRLPLLFYQEISRPPRGPGDPGED